MKYPSQTLICVMILVITASLVKTSCKKRNGSDKLTSYSVNGGFVDSKLELAIKSAKSLEDFIKNKDLQEYRNNATIMTESQSIQSASTDFPRVILFSNDYKTLISYESLPARDNSQQVEIIQYNSKNGDYEFYEAQLGEKSSIQNMTGSDKCSTCHHGAPIWEPYDFWPGSIPRASVCRSDTEEKYFQKDLVKNNILLNKLNLGCTTSNNLKLADGLRNSHHFEYVSRRLQRLKNYKKLKFAIAASLMDCPNIEIFNKGIEGFNSARIATLRSEVEVSLEKMDKDIYDLLVRDSLGVSTDVAVGLSYLLYNQGLDFQELFMSFESKFFISPLQGQIYTLFKSFVDSDPDLTNLPLYRVWTGNSSMTFGIDDEVKFAEAKNKSSDVEKIQFSEWGISEYFADPKRWDHIDRHAAIGKACETLQTLSKSAILGRDTDAKIRRYNGWFNISSH